VTGREFSAGGGDQAVPGLSARDLDLLADFVGGALDDTPVGRDVARLVSEDPAWRAAHGELVAATAAVSADLAAWGRSTESMPADVAARLTAVLADAGAARTEKAGERGADARDPDGPRDIRPRLSLVPGEAPGGSDRRPLSRWAAPLVAAAAVVIAVVLGLQVLPGLDSASDDAGSTSGGADLFGEEGERPAGAPAAPEAARASALPDRPVRRFVASGADYRRDSLPLLTQSTPRAAADPPGASKAARDADAGVTAAEVPLALRRLIAPAELSACLSAVGAAHPRPATDVDLVDYAAFEGSPALIVRFTDSAGERWVYAAGPDCGRAGVGADTRYRSRVR
jgi:hypothetical protein